MKWQRKITKKEMKHLKENLGGYVTLDRFRDLRKSQRALRAEGDAKGYGPGTAEPCWTCKAIAQKLGIEESEADKC